MIFNAVTPKAIDRRLAYEVERIGREHLFTVGKGSYFGEIMLAIIPRLKRTPHLLLGRFSSLADGLNFLTGVNHSYKTVSTYPFDIGEATEKIFGVAKTAHTFNIPNHYQIIVGHDVWIGYGVTIMGGVKIGNGAVIGAGSVVAKDIPPYAIVVGNPARVIKHRFNEVTIKKLLAVKWWNWSLDKIADNLPIMNDVEKFLELHYSPELDNFPEDDISRRLSATEDVYHFIADFRAQSPLWSKVVRDFAESDFKNKLLVIWLGRDATDDDFKSLAKAVNLIGNGVKKNILVVDVEEKNFLPAALRKATHFITTREMTTLEALDYLWDTDVKIVSALDDGIFA